MLARTSGPGQQRTGSLPLELAPEPLLRWFAEHGYVALVLDPIAAQLRSVFPRQRMAVEGYTDNSPMYGGQVSTSHQLASAQAAAVLDLLVRRAGMPPQQLFTVAQGTNNPRATNDTPAGRSTNRRIELVIYPDTF